MAYHVPHTVLGLLFRSAHLRFVALGCQVYGSYFTEEETLTYRG